MQEISEVRSRYLALALASRKVLRSLERGAQIGHADPQLELTLKQLLESLQDADQDKNLFGPAPSESPFTNYEQVITLEEVVADMKDQNILQSLSNLLSVEGNAESRKLDAANAARFFYTLENRALHHYSRQVGSRES